ncbi:MAG TPA: protein-glutamate O-methyltransferase CheR [Bacillota bacterium]|jgi:chemotaxis protein methyltransferase CheR
MEADYNYFCNQVEKLTGIHLASYKRPQMERRLKAFMGRLGVDCYVSLTRLMEKDEGRLKEFKDFLTINVSDFFRNTDKFDELRERFLRPAAQCGQHLRIWSAGCSNGSEPYSLAIILEELGSPHGHTIWATDIDEEILRRAKAGRYRGYEIRNVDRARRDRHFAQTGPDEWTIGERFQQRVEFSYHNLLDPTFPSGFDLILCRNVVIYFTEDAKDELYRKFSQSLKPSGVLFVGGAESIFKAQELGLESVAPFFYRKRAA